VRTTSRLPRRRRERVVGRVGFHVGFSWFLISVISTPPLLTMWAKVHIIMIMGRRMFKESKLKMKLVTRFVEH